MDFLHFFTTITSKIQFQKNKFSVFFGLGLITSDRAKHKIDCKMFNRFFVRRHIESHLPMVNREVKRIISERLTNLSPELR